MVAHGETSITLSWSPVPNAYSYRVDSTWNAYEGFAQDLSGVFLGTTWQTAMTGDGRYYRVIALGSGQESAPSNHVGFVEYQGDLP
jgi:hypothetical protein